MRSLLLIILLFSFCFEIKGQGEQGTFVIVKIEKKTSSDLHPYAIDYWMVSRDLWKEYSSQAIVPIYLYGFSRTDYNECSQDNKLVLYNYTKDEVFDFESGYEESQKRLLALIKENSREVQTVNKKWKGYKERIKISLTPINGKFCFCQMVHNDGRQMPEYAKKIGMPASDFNYDPSFWESQEFKEIRRFDYTELDFVSLQQTRQ